jgi:hypothetical protein
MPRRRAPILIVLLAPAAALSAYPAVPAALPFGLREARAAAQAPAQSTAQMSAEDNFRREPNGAILGRLGAGAPLRMVAREGNWVEVDVEGWVWLASLQAASGELDLSVSVAGGENLRAGPSGAIVGRLSEGTLLEELAREPGWAQIRRRGWIWAASVEGGAASATAAAPPAPRPTATAAGRGATAPVSAGPTARQPDGFTRIGAGGAPILAAPDGDTLALAAADRELQVVAREGNWARVRLEGWVWLPPGGTAADAGPPAALRPEELVREPSAHVGRVVVWELQFISLERAESIRTDFRRGEPFLLTRFGGPDGPFVYVAVPPDRLAETQGLVPLERISVTARVRTGASTLTETPIVDLLSLENTR